MNYPTNYSHHPKGHVTLIDLLALMFIVYSTIGIGKLVAAKYGTVWGFAAGIPAFAICVSAVVVFYKACWRGTVKKCINQTAGENQASDPDSGIIAKPPDCFCRLVKRTRRGPYIFGILWLGSVVLICLAANTPGYKLCALIGFFASFIFFFGGMHVGERHAPLLKISKNPQLVFWAHPSEGIGQISKTPIENCCNLALHLRDGSQVTVYFSPMQMQEFALWLKEQNPTIRWGDYDHPINEAAEPEGNSENPESGDKK
ncbi:hypothetical protein LLG95_16990 [bacterium]|nr:hypothetical protein [bacterium]